jgi:hypothetical protein
MTTKRAKDDVVHTKYNRGIEKISFRQSSKGETIVQVKVYLVLRTSGEALNLSFDIQISVNDNPLNRIFVDDVYVDESAITCAVTCAGACPSIFGDGICTGCGCNYSNWFTALLGDDVNPGDRVRATIVPARGGVSDQYTDDNSIEVVFEPPIYR